MKMRSGFSFIEIVFAVAIVGVMLAVLVPNVVGRFNQSRIDATKASLRAVKSAIDMFNADTSTYPNELNDLVERPTDERIAAKWASPYLEKLSRDSWDNELQYERTSQGAEHPYELYSFGPHGESGADEERLSVWS